MKSVFLLLFNLTWVTFSAQTEEKSTTAKIDSLFKEYDKTDTPGCAVLIVKNQQVIFKKAYGMANLSYNLPITPASVFDIASVSKQFTGYAIASLIQQGKISVNDDIHKYLPDVPQFGKAITIGNLLYHTSGLRDWPEALNMAGWRWDETFTFEDIMRMLKNQKDLDFEPGSKVSYSNTGYNVLAAIVEKVTGMTFRNWVDAYIFKPLSMNSSQVMDNHKQVINSLASSYKRKGENFNYINDALTAYGSSSIYSSAEDLAKWVIYFQKGLASHDPVFSKMLEESKLTNGKKNDYGYGLMRDNVDGVKTISHTGAWAGYCTIIVNYPDEQLSVIILSNAGGFNPSLSAKTIAELFLKNKFKPQPVIKDSIANLPNVKIAGEVLNTYAGTFKLGEGWYATFTIENGQLMVQATDEAKFPVEAKSDTLFWIPAYHSYVTFKRTDGKVNALIYKGNTANRVIRVKPSLTLLNTFTGIFHSPELETDYVITVVNGKLQAHHMRLGNFDLEADLVSPYLFISNIGAIQFVKNKDGKISGFKISGNRVKNIQFEKR